MSLYTRMKTDTARILGGDDMHDLTLTNASSASQTAKGRVTDTSFQVTPGGQLVFTTGKNSVAFFIDSFSDITGVDETYKNWKASFLNSKGESETGRFNNIYVNKTHNYVLANLTKDKDMTS